MRAHKYIYCRGNLLNLEGSCRFLKASFPLTDFACRRQNFLQQNVGQQSNLTVLHRIIQTVHSVDH